MADQKTCLVAGGAGFIGSHLCDALLSRGFRVVCLDNLVTGSEENIKQAKANPEFSFVRHDLTIGVPEVSSVDYIFHLASPASPKDFVGLSEEIALVNSMGTKHLLELAREHGASFLFASTSEVYGDPKEHPQKETYWGNVNPNGPRSCYDESKRFGEMITGVYRRKYHVNARIIRIFNTYGPRMKKDDGRVVSNFINQALEGKPLTVYGQGEQTRSFCYVSDLVEGILKAMFTEKTDGETINLGNFEEYKVIDFAKKILTMTDSQSSVEYKPLPIDDPMQRRPDITKAKQLLGWQPVVSVDAGLEKTIEYFKGLRGV